MWRSNGFVSPDASRVLADLAPWLVLVSLAIGLLALGFAAGALR
jgi:hypothetical protein